MHKMPVFLIEKKDDLLWAGSRVPETVRGNLLHIL